MNLKPELIAPAGNMVCARAAVANGADAVYFGLPRFNARMRADNFTTEALPELVRFLHEHRVRALCVFNVLVFTDELAEAEQQLILLDEAGVDAVMVQDLGLAVLARELGVTMEVHASTQMTISSPEGVAFVKGLGITRVVLARETSLGELAKFGDTGVSLEMFIHGALCVAYSGQCLTSEALGQRSANRGECAQACRLPYDLVVDGVVKDLGDRRYLLSPQDLAAVKEIPELIRLGVTGFKIEGRLKSPEYVAATTQVYRKAIDAALESLPSTGDATDQYKLEMTFSRGLYSGWMHGVNHQQLVHGRFGKKRGPLMGLIKSVSHDHVEMATACALQPGDGVVFDTGGDTDQEQGGRIWQVKDRCLYFEFGHIDFTRLKAGDRVWKTSDPQLERALRKSFAGEIPKPKRTIDLLVTGSVGKSLTVEASLVENGDSSPLSNDQKSADESAHSITASVRVHSSMPLQTAYKRPLTEKGLRDQLGRMGETNYVLGELRNKLVGQVILPVSELNRLRRELIEKIVAARPEASVSRAATKPVLSRLLTAVSKKAVGNDGSASTLVALCRTMDQVGVALEVGCPTIYVDFEDIRRYQDAVALVRADASRAAVVLATPRIQKAGERAFFKLIESAKPDGVLIRNIGALDYFHDSPLRKVGDFSLNVANPLAADVLIQAGLERLTISYDLNAQQVLDLLRAAPPQWFELTIHQHMPMFHMEHCVFAAFLSTGTDASNCGRPCDTHNLKLRDRVGMEHPVKADVGCRNTVFHARAQSGAEFLKEFQTAGARVFRAELLEEDATKTRAILQSYRELIDGTQADPAAVVRRLNAVRQLGVTSGTLTVLS